MFDSCYKVYKQQRPLYSAGLLTRLADRVSRTPWRRPTGRRRHVLIRSRMSSTERNDIADLPSAWLRFANAPRGKRGSAVHFTRSP